MNDPFALTEESITRAVKAHDALMLHCADARLRREWERTLHPIPCYQTRAGDALYEPSQPAPRHDKALVAIVLTLMAFAAVAGFIRRMRPESRMACFALALAAVALLKGWGAA